MKKTKFPATYLAVVAVAGFAAWVYFSEYKGGEAKEQAQAEASTLIPFSISNVMLTLRSFSNVWMRGIGLASAPQPTGAPSP